jgi:hypothetical protein
MILEVRNTPFLVAETSTTQKWSVTSGIVRGILQEIVEKKTCNVISNKYMKNFRNKNSMVCAACAGNKGTKQKNTGLIQPVQTKGVPDGVRNKKLQMQVLMKNQNWSIV